MKLKKADEEKCEYKDEYEECPFFQPCSYNERCGHLTCKIDKNSSRNVCSSYRRFCYLRKEREKLEKEGKSE